MHMSKAGMDLCVSQGSFSYEGDLQQVARNDQHRDSDSTGQSDQRLLIMYSPYIGSILIAD